MDQPHGSAAAEAPIRVGLVGANPERGWGSGVHRRVVEFLPGFTLTAVCTTKADSATEAARRFGARHAFTEAGALAAHPEVDLVSICVLAPHHYDIARAALEAGKHIYCEWPLALTVSQAEELARLSREKNVKAAVGLDLRGAPALRYAADLIANGFIGRLTDVNLHARVPGSITRTMAVRAGGTTLLTIYVAHLIDALGHHFGAVEAWSARGATHLPPVDERGEPVARDAPDQVLIQGTLAGGALFSMDVASNGMAGLGFDWRIGGSDGVIALRSAAADLPAKEALALFGARNGQALAALPVPERFDCPAIPAAPDRYPAYPGVDASRAALVATATLYQRLGQAIRENGSVNPDFGQAVRTQRLIASIDGAICGA